MFVDVSGVDTLLLFFEFAAGKADVFEKFFYQSMQATGTNVFSSFIDLLSHLG